MGIENPVGDASFYKPAQDSFGGNPQTCPGIYKKLRFDPILVVLFKIYLLTGVASYTFKIHMDV